MLQGPLLGPVAAGRSTWGARAAPSRRLLPQVDDLKAKLAIQEAELKQKNENADKLIQVVGVETEKVSKEKAIADEEEAKVEVINKVGGRPGPRGRLHASTPQGSPGRPGQRLRSPQSSGTPPTGSHAPHIADPRPRRQQPRELVRNAGSWARAPPLGKCMF